MRHNRDIKRFSRPGGHLRCMLANMTNDLITHGRIKTTTSKAKELRRYVERMITLGKSGSVPARRRAMAFMRSKTAVHKLFGEVAPKYADRNGGYTRILKLGIRIGDAAPISIIELVEGPEEAVAAKKPAPKKRALAKAKAPAKPKAPAKASGDKEPEKKAAASKKPAAEKKAAPKKAAPKKAAPKKDEE